jgi:hypothetical protein
MIYKKALKVSVRYYVYLMCFLATLVLFLGSPSEPFIIKILFWLFVCLVVYRNLYKFYFTDTVEDKALEFFLGFQNTTFMHILRAVWFFLVLWIITYTTVKLHTSISNLYASLIGLSNGLLYGFFLFAKVYVE